MSVITGTTWPSTMDSTTWVPSGSGVIFTSFPGMSGPVTVTSTSPSPHSRNYDRRWRRCSLTQDALLALVTGQGRMYLDLPAVVDVTRFVVQDVVLREDMIHLVLDHPVFSPPGSPRGLTTTDIFELDRIPHYMRRGDV